MNYDLIYSTTNMRKPYVPTGNPPGRPPKRNEHGQFAPHTDTESDDPVIKRRRRRRKPEVVIEGSIIPIWAGGLIATLALGVIAYVFNPWRNRNG